MTESSISFIYDKNMNFCVVFFSRCEDDGFLDLKFSMDDDETSKEAT